MNISLKGTRRRLAASTNACANPVAAAREKGEEKEGGRRQTRRGTAKKENAKEAFNPLVTRKNSPICANE